MQDAKDTRTDLGEAHAGLEAKLGQLKELLEAKVATVERPFQWLHDNALLVVLGAGAALLLLSLTRRRDPNPRARLG